jgi:hypothetical protein
MFQESVAAFAANKLKTGALKNANDFFAFEPRKAGSYRDLLNADQFKRTTGVRLALQA